MLILFYIVALISVLLEAAFFNYLAFFMVKPNLILLLIAIFSFYFNFEKLKVISFCLFCGFLKDVFSSMPFGTHMLMFLSIGIGLSYISQRFLRYNWIFIIPLFIFATLSQGLIYFLIQVIFFNKEISLLDIPWRVLVLEVLYGLLIFFAFFKIIKKCVIDKLL